MKMTMENLQVFDTHCHLDLVSQNKDFEQKIAPDWLEKAAENGVGAVTQIGTDWASSLLAAALANHTGGSRADVPSVIQDGMTRWGDISRQTYQRLLDFPFQKVFDLYYTIGLHPCHYEQAGEVPEIKALARGLRQDPLFRAIGEIGLDYYWEPESREYQLPVFEEFVALSQELERPVVVHCRDKENGGAAFQETYDILKTRHNGKGILHCFTGNAEWARRFCDLGYYISFSGIVTFRSATELQEAAKIVPPDRILVETDAPYLAPVPRRGKTNQPAYVRHTLEFLAELRGAPLDTLAGQVFENSKRIFELDS